MNLTKSDCSVIIEALEHLPSKNMGAEMFGELLGCMLGRESSEEDKERQKRERKEREEVRLAEKEALKRKSAILIAKIITIQDSIQE